MAALAQEQQVGSDERVYAFYKKYAWKQIALAQFASGRILRTVYCQFGNWCVQNEYMVGDDNDTKLFWLERILPFLCSEDPCVAVLNGHTDSVWSVLKVNETTVVSAEDRTLRVWDLTTNTCTATLGGHTDSVWSVAIVNETTVVSGSDDETLRVWDLTTNTCTAVLNGHVEPVYSVLKVNETTVVSAGDRTLRVGELTTKT